MAVTTLTGRTARAVLDNGTDPNGNQLTVNVAISGISKVASAWDADKFLNIIGALEPCLSKGVVSAETVETLTVASNS